MWRDRSAMPDRERVPGSRARTQTDRAAHRPRPARVRRHRRELDTTVVPKRHNNAPVEFTADISLGIDQPATGPCSNRLSPASSANGRLL
jgi:hypothetical protein